MYPKLGTGRILLIEDDADLRDALSQILRDEGYEVVGAANGRDAIDRLRGGQRVDVILLDLTMPVMNGWQFRAEQREDPLLSRIPVIVISAGNDLSAQMPVLGLEEYIRKPIRLETLLDSLARHCA